MGETEKLSIIPEVFYDLISRVPAGAIIVILGSRIWPAWFQELTDSPFYSTNLAAVLMPVVLLIISYVIGLALSAFSGIWLFKRLDRENIETIRQSFDELLARFHAEEIYFLSDFDLDERDKIRTRGHVFLKQQDARVGLEMAKHQAESSLFANLTIGTALLFVVVSLLTFLNKCYNMGSTDVAPLTLALLLALSVFWDRIAYLRNKTYWRYHFRYMEDTLRRMKKEKESVDGKNAESSANGKAIQQQNSDRPGTNDYASAVTVIAILMAVEYSTKGYDAWDLFIGVVVLFVSLKFAAQAIQLADSLYSFLSAALFAFSAKIALIGAMGTGYQILNCTSDSLKLDEADEMKFYIAFVFITFSTWWFLIAKSDKFRRR